MDKSTYIPGAPAYKATPISINEMTQTSMMFLEQSYNQRHGGPYDRGQADSYYGREYSPHYFTGDSYNSTRLELVDMSAKEIADYTAGYRDNEANGDKKEY